MNEHKLLIRFVYQKNGKVFKKIKNLVQGKPFAFGLSIKNVGEKSSAKATLKNFRLSSSEGGTIVYDREEEFAIDELHPGQEITLWWPDQLTTTIKGQSWVSCDVVPGNKDADSFITYQYDLNCDKEFRYKLENSWGDSILIRGVLEQQQAKTNFLMLILTILIFLDGVWGLDILFGETINFLKWLLSGFGEFLIKLS